MRTHIDSNEDILDSRDVMENMEALDGTDDPDEQEELALLEDLYEQGSSLPDWQYGVTLIRDSYFEEYARTYYDDVYGNLGYLQSYIDWDRVARDLQQDYTELTYDDVTYWAR